jgi:hypothetical protein
LCSPRRVSFNPSSLKPFRAARYSGHQRPMSASQGPRLTAELAAILKLSGQKAKQHYVFRRYLRPRCTNQQVALLRNGVAKMVGVGDVAVQKYFCELQELTEADVTLVHVRAAPARFAVDQRTNRQRR